MNTQLKIKSFRVFDENGVTFEFKPITILTGTNSSGKSSAVKAAFLLNSFLSQIKKASDKGAKIEIDKYKLDFSQYPNNLLGRFDKIVNSSSKTKTITIEYSTYSLMLSKHLNVQLVFSADTNDELNNGYLQSLAISSEDGVIYSSERNGETYCNLNILRNDFSIFVLAEWLIHQYTSLSSEYEFNHDSELTEEDFKKISHAYIDELKSFGKKRVIDILRYVRTSSHKKSIADDLELNVDKLSTIDKIEEKKSIFSIPVLEELSKVNKADIAGYIDNSFLKDASKELIFASHKVITSFLDSSAETISDFFVEYETNYLQHVVCRGLPFLIPGGTVRMLKSIEMELRLNYLFSYPSSASFIFSLDDNEKVEEVDNQAKIKAWEEKPLSFEMLYELIMSWNRIYSPEKTPAYVDEESMQMFSDRKVYHHSYLLLSKFAESIVEEAVCPTWSGNMSYVSSSRAKVNRLYTLDDNDDFTQLLRRYFEYKRLYLSNQEYKSTYEKSGYKVDSFMNKWIEKFGIGQRLSLCIDEEGLGVQIRLHKAADDKGNLLADEGYGITQLVSILLQIETAILSAKGVKINRFYGLEYLDGYDSYKFHYEVNTIAIEEPEIHLHPAYQSLLADMFVEAYQKYNIHFIIETHSEYLIRKTQVLVANMGYSSNKEAEEKCPIQTLYIPIRPNRPYPLGYRKDGKFKEDFGTGFYDESSNLAFEIL